jgi:hypothetical protein
MGLVDLAVAIADGAEAIFEIAVLADRPVLFGPVTSDSTCWRVLDVHDEGWAWATRSVLGGPGVRPALVAAGPCAARPT